MKRVDILWAVGFAIALAVSFHFIDLNGHDESCFVIPQTTCSGYGLAGPPQFTWDGAISIGCLIYGPAFVFGILLGLQRISSFKFVGIAGIVALAGISTFMMRPMNFNWFSLALLPLRALALLGLGPAVLGATAGLVVQKSAGKFLGGNKAHA